MNTSYEETEKQTGGLRQSYAATYLKFTAVIVYVPLVLGLGHRLGVALWTTNGWLAFLPAVLAGYLAVDFASGTAHWFCDTFFDEETPVIGRALIAPFRDHHVNPRAITTYRFLEQDGSNYILVLPPLLYSWWTGGPIAGSALSLIGHSFLFSFALTAIGVNLFHKWAHARKVPPGVRWLQSHNLIISPTRHGVHHWGDHTKGYCVATGWMNKILDPIGFFPRLERAIRAALRPLSSAWTALNRPPSRDV